MIRILVTTLLVAVLCAAPVATSTSSIYAGASVAGNVGQFQPDVWLDDDQVADYRDVVAPNSLDNAIDRVRCHAVDPCWDLGA